MSEDVNEEEEEEDMEENNSIEGHLKKRGRVNVHSTSK